MWLSFGCVNRTALGIGRAAVENFCSEPLPPADTPEYLARLVPVERTCPATVKVRVSKRSEEEVILKKGFFLYPFPSRR